MSNHNIPSSQENTNERHYHPYSMDRSRIIAAGATILALSLGASVAAESHHNATPSTTKEVTLHDKILEAIHDGPDVGHTITSTIQEGQATSIVIEQAAQELEKIDNLGFLEGQQAVTLESSKDIDATVYKQTGGSVQPGDQIDTWRDDKTHYVVSAVHTIHKP